MVLPTHVLEEVEAVLSALDPAQGVEEGPHDRFVLRLGYEEGDVVMCIPIPSTLFCARGG